MIALLEKVDASIKAEKYAEAVALMEESFDDLAPEDRIALGLLLIFPPFGDCEEARFCFESVFDTNDEFEAAVWFEYVYCELLPEGKSAEKILLKYTDKSEACFMLARRAEKENRHEDAVNWLKKAIAIEPLPTALLHAFDYVNTHPEFWNAKQKAKPLVRRWDLDGTEELGPNLNEREILRSDSWKELIRGEIVTDVIYNHHFKCDHHTPSILDKYRESILAIIHSHDGKIVRTFTTGGFIK